MGFRRALPCGRGGRWDNRQDESGAGLLSPVTHQASNNTHGSHTHVDKGDRTQDAGCAKGATASLASGHRWMDALRPRMAYGGADPRKAGTNVEGLPVSVQEADGRQCVPTPRTAATGWWTSNPACTGTRTEGCLPRALGLPPSPVFGWDLGSFPPTGPGHSSLRPL